MKKKKVFIRIAGALIALLIIVGAVMALNNSLVRPESCHLLTGESPVSVVAREPSSRRPVLPGDWLC